MTDPTFTHCPYCPRMFRSDERAVRFVHVQGHRDEAEPVRSPVRPWRPLYEMTAEGMSWVWDEHEERWIDRKDPSR